MTAGWPDDLADLRGVRAVQQAVDDVVERPIPWEEIEKGLAGMRDTHTFDPQMAIEMDADECGCVLNQKHIPLFRCNSTDRGGGTKLIFSSGRGNRKPMDGWYENIAHENSGMGPGMVHELEHVATSDCEQTSMEKNQVA